MNAASALLGIIARDDDLGAKPIGLQDLQGEAIKSKLSILTQHDEMPYRWRQNAS